MNKDSKIYVAGHKGLVGSAIVRNLINNGYNNLILKTHKELELLNQTEVENFFKEETPEYVFLAAAKVGGIYANNTYPADFIYNNLQIQCNVIYNAYKYKAKKLLFLGSSCIYPKFSTQPINESCLLSDKLEETNKAYAIAKIAGLIMCESYNRQFETNFISVMPTNLYGISDNYQNNNSHVLPALIRKFHEAKINNLPNVNIWGTGSALREFLFSDDLADACIFLMNNYNDSEIINIGSGSEISIKKLAMLIKNILNYEGSIIFDTSKSDGTPRKLLDCSKLNLMGWKPKISLEGGIKITYNDFLNSWNNGKIK